jgi:hypothetical protein
LLGDLLKSDRGLFYSHYGVDLGDGRVLEFSGDFAKDVATARPRISWWDDFEAGHGSVVVLQANCPLDEVVARANEMLLSGKSYNVFFRNCEHLARYVVTGKWTSSQINGWAFALGAVYVWSKLPD